MIPEINHPVSPGPKHPSKQNIFNTLSPAMSQTVFQCIRETFYLFEFMQYNK